MQNSEKCTFGGLKGWSLSTGGLKDRFDCICTLIQVHRVVHLAAVLKDIIQLLARSIFYVKCYLIGCAGIQVKYFHVEVDILVR